MFEILQAFETARHEKNKLLRFFLMRHVRRKLKTSFFEKFNKSIKYRELKPSKELLEEFNQFFNCTDWFGRVSMRYAIEPQPFMMDVKNNNIYISYHHYRIKYSFLEDTCNIDIHNYDTGKSVLIHPDIDDVFYGYFGVIILIAIYNYCVTYIYGGDSKLYIYDHHYLGLIHVQYFN